MWYVSFHIVLGIVLIRIQRDAAAIKGEYDAIVVPGGAKGAETMSQSPLVQLLVKSFYEQGKYVGMICAGTTPM